MPSNHSPTARFIPLRGVWNCCIRTATLGVLLGGALVSRMQAQVSELGAAANFAGLELSADSSQNSTDEFAISKNTTSITGNVGVAANGYLNYSGGGTITGTIYAGSGATVSISGGSSATGGVVEPYAAMTQIVADAANAATYYAGLTATQTFSSISGSRTFTGTGGLDVIDINGNVDFEKGDALTISGNASDQFVINIDASSGEDLQFNGGSSIVLNGVSASQVVFNLIGSGTELSTTGDSDTSAVFLAENGSIDISGGVHDSDFISGGTLTFQSGVNITQAAGFTPVPELNPALMAGCALVLIFGLAMRSGSEGRRPKSPVV
jgi:hypothetical protein